MITVGSGFEVWFGSVWGGGSELCAVRDKLSCW